MSRESSLRMAWKGNAGCPPLQPPSGLEKEGQYMAGGATAERRTVIQSLWHKTERLPSVTV